MPRTDQAIVSREAAPGARATRPLVARPPTRVRPATGVDQLLELQRTRGNAFVARAIQFKLAVSQPGDAFEQEADRVAQSVVGSGGASQAPGTVDRAEEPDVTISRMCSDCREEVGRQAPPIEEEDKDKKVATLQRQKADEKDKDENAVQMKSADGGAFDVEADTESSIRGLSGGNTMAAPVRSDMESRMGFDFSGVRVHTDSNAAGLARSVNALAFTYGNDVVFGSGQYRPETEGGKKLLAHELTHVVQQTGGTPSRAKADADKR